MEPGAGLLAYRCGPTSVGRARCSNRRRIGTALTFAGGETRERASASCDSASVSVGVSS